MSRSQRLAVVFALNFSLVIALVTIGVTAHSLAVLAEGGDYLLDAAGAALALLAIRLAARSPGRPGRPAVTALAALVNCGWLLLLEVFVAAAAADRLITRTPAVHGLPVLVVSGVAALAMTAGVLVLRADDDADDADDADAGNDGGRDLSVAAVMLDTVADAAAAAGVAATGGIILATGGWYWLDPAVALVIAVIIGYHALALLRKVVNLVTN
ncbi:MAG TPA: cation diffusion facilitator family transporter [Streptosporangiaceae bacterium]|nr:cation diffusion facilitator family transporter [Streptosporangiaceae bacterium]